MFFIEHFQCSVYTIFKTLHFEQGYYYSILSGLLKQLFLYFPVSLCFIFQDETTPLQLLNSNRPGICLLFVSTYFRAIHLFTHISPISLYLYSLYTPISLYLSPYSPIPFSYNPNNTFSGVIGALNSGL